MRPIKFRAWDGKNKKMYTNNHIVIYLGEVFLEDASLDAHCIHIKKEDIELVPMQWTWLLDNTKFESLTEQEQKKWLETHTKEEWNWKEIYEGDIIRHNRRREWYEPVYYFEEVKMESEECSNDCSGWTWYNTFCTNWEVFGNIYQNPNLLPN